MSDSRLYKLRAGNQCNYPNKIKASVRHYCYTRGLGVTTPREKGTFIRRQDKKGRREPAKNT